MKFQVLSVNSQKAQCETRQSLCHRKNYYYRTVQKSSAGRSCGIIDDRIFDRFSDLFSLSVSHNQLDIIKNDQQMMSTQRNGIKIEAELCKKGLNDKDSRRTR